jgi:hypothetical protein
MTKATRIKLPVLQLWASVPGWVINTQREFARGERNAAKADLTVRLRDRQANGEAFAGERIRQRTAVVSVSPGVAVFVD